jgi:predicted membrane protein
MESIMEESPGVRPTPQLIFALLIIIAGVLFTLDNLDILELRPFFRFWPLALMAFGAAKFFEANRPSSQVAGVVFFGAGSLFLLRNLNVLHFQIGALWPLILVVIGGSMLHKAMTRANTAIADTDSTVTALALLGGVERTVNTQDFRGGDLTAVMGGCEIDLRPAAMLADQAVLNVFAFWGGIEIRVPEEWLIVVHGLPILGGFGDSTRLRKMTDTGRPGVDVPAKRLVIKGLVVMGGVEIKN